MEGLVICRSAATGLLRRRASHRQRFSFPDAESIGHQVNELPTQGVALLYSPRMASSNSNAEEDQRLFARLQVLLMSAALSTLVERNAVHGPTDFRDSTAPHVYKVGLEHGQPFVDQLP